MSNPPPRQSRRLQARRRRGARSDVSPVETSGVTPGTASERPHSVPPQPMVQGSVEPPTVGTLTGQGSMEDVMRGVSKAVEAGIQAAISPLLQLTSQQGAGHLSSGPPAGMQNAEDMPPPPATSGGPQPGAVGCTATKGLPAVGRETLPPAPLVQHIPLCTVGCTGEGVHNSDGNGSSNGGGAARHGMAVPRGRGTARYVRLPTTGWGCRTIPPGPYCELHSGPRHPGWRRWHYEQQWRKPG